MSENMETKIHTLISENDRLLGIISLQEIVSSLSLVVVWFILSLSLSLVYVVLASTLCYQP